MKSVLAVGLITRLSQINVIVGIVLAILGIAISILAMRISKAIRKTNDVQPNDKLVLTFKSIGLLLIVVALIVLVIE